jgi:hypothetical protein
VPAPPPRMIASTRFMPLPPFGYAGQTYWIFRVQNQPVGQIVEIAGNQSCEGAPDSKSKILSTT